MNAMARHLPKGVLVVFEGIDGAGKTTQAQALVASLCESGYDAVYGKEPTDGPWGQKIKRSASTVRMPLDEEITAFLEDRKEHCAKLVVPALKEGKIAVLDRYYYSTAAYQGERGADPDEILRMNEVFAPQPDAMFILEVPIDVSMDRIKRRGCPDNEFEKEESLARCAEIFKGIDRPYIRRLNGCLPISELSYDIEIAVQEGLLRQSEWSSSTPSNISLVQLTKLAEQIRDDSSVPVNEKAETLLRAAIRSN